MFLFFLVHDDRFRWENWKIEVHLLFVVLELDFSEVEVMKQWLVCFLFP